MSRPSVVPSLRLLRRRGKQLLLDVRSGKPEALSRLNEFLPPQRKKSLSSDSAAFGLRDALLVVAREYGFLSWARLRVAELGDADLHGSTTRLLDIEPTGAPTRAAGALHDMLHAGGRQEWSTSRLLGVLGNAFRFEMRAGGGMVWQEANLDWWQLLPRLESCCPVRRFQLRGESRSSEALMAAAWDAACKQIERGLPVVAWCPMSPDPGAPRDWGLVVGFDDASESYIVRRQGGDVTVRYDEIGQVDPEWYSIVVYDPAGGADETRIHLDALRNSVAIAQGTGYDSTQGPFRVDACGFGAFRLWRDAVEANAGIPKQQNPRSLGLVRDSHYTSGELRALRAAAASYVRELVNLFPSVAPRLVRSSAAYDRVVDAAGALQRLFEGALDAGHLSADGQSEATQLIENALKCEESAVSEIESAIAIMADSQP